MAKAGVKQKTKKASAEVAEPVEKSVEVASAIQLWPIEKVKPYKRNAKSHPPEQIKALARLMERVGFDVPLVVDPKGQLIKGHGRLLAAKSLGLESVPVIVRDLDEARKGEARLGDNRLAEFGWDMDALVADVVEGLQRGLDIELTGFTLKELGLEAVASSVGGTPIEVPTFDPASPDAQGKLDEKEPIECPKCKHLFHL